MLEILHASAARDAETHDSSFASFVWNISQNASREKHRTTCPGISGCITPGGEVFLPHLGRPLLGCEKLLLQGIPYFRLLLGTESEVQLGDLAGTAMSLTVVGACLLGAITCGQLRFEVESKMSKKSSACAAKEVVDSILNDCCIEQGPTLVDDESKLGKQKSGLTDGCKFLGQLAMLAEEAIQTSVWCTVRPIKAVFVPTWRC
jgi:hypothetical protein